MGFGSKEMLNALIGLIIKILDFQSGSLNIFSWVLIGIFVASFLIILMYKRFNEINDDLEKQKSEYLELDKKLKIYEKLIN